eukprot:3321243-Pyramimonas_sp.AAC.2
MEAARRQSRAAEDMSGIIQVSENTAAPSARAKRKRTENDTKNQGSTRTYGVRKESAGELNPLESGMTAQ